MHPQNEVYSGNTDEQQKSVGGNPNRTEGGKSGYKRGVREKNKLRYRKPGGMAPSEEPPTMSGIQSKALQLEPSHHEITEDIMATVNQTTMTEAEEDTPLFRQRLQKVLRVKFIAATTKKDRNLRPLINFVKKRDWEAMKSVYG